MSQPRPITGNPIAGNRASRVLVTVAGVGESLLHPVEAVRRLRSPRSRPNSPDIVKMTPEEFAAFAKRTGIEARLTKVLAEVEGSGNQPAADSGLHGSKGRP